MIAEELARLKPPLCCGNHETLVARLLEERERLLEALNEIATHTDPDTMRVLAYGAIASASATAPAGKEEK